MITLMNETDVVTESYLENYTNQYLVLKPEALSAEYRSAKYQLFHATGGFGCDPSKMGTAVFGTFCADGENARMERFHFMGIATDEALATWKAEYGELTCVKDEV